MSQDRRRSESRCDAAQVASKGRRGDHHVGSGFRFGAPIRIRGTQLGGSLAGKLCIVWAYMENAHLGAEVYS
jgi:hypothetical protein